MQRQDQAKNIFFPHAPAQVHTPQKGLLSLGACLRSREGQLLHSMWWCWAEGWVLGCFEGWPLAWVQD